MARVVMACVLKHHTRRGERDPERWQMASQLVTHALIRDAGFTLPPDAQAWDGLTVEQAYDRLRAEDGDSGYDGNASADASAADPEQSPPDADDDDTGNPTDSADDGDGHDADEQGEGPGRSGPERQPRRRRRCVRCAAEPRSVRHWRGHGRGRPRRRQRRVRRSAAGHHRRGAGVGRGHAPGAQHCEGRGKGARPGRGDHPGRAREHARLADALAPLHDRRGEPRLQLERPQPALHRLRALPAVHPFGGHRHDCLHY